jgi:hypothetical protein
VKRRMVVCMWWRAPAQKKINVNIAKPLGDMKMFGDASIKDHRGASKMNKLIFCLCD